MPKPELSTSQVSQLTHEELTHLQSTYSSLIKSVAIKENLLQLTTLENNEFLLLITSEGWRVMRGGQSADRERTWEMVEDLLRSISPQFKDGWDAMLLEKLHHIAQAQVEAEENNI
jgi:Protein of unknown function (DUF727)